MPENFENPPAEEEPGPEELLGERSGEGAGEARLVEKEPATPEEVEAEFEGRMQKLEELKKEIGDEYARPFGDLRLAANQIVKDKIEAPGSPELVRLVEEVNKKEKQIRDDRDEKLKKLARQRRENLAKRVGEI